jgi:hypothetical protein
MQQASAPLSATGGLAQQRKVRGEVMCRFCRSGRVYRIYREGFLQRRIYPLFGFYPWRCRTCKTSVMLHKRTNEK